MNDIINVMKAVSLLVLTFLLALTSCGRGKSTIKEVKVSESSFSKFVNEKSTPVEPNLALDKTIINKTYPIEIAFYNDNKFFYNLPTLASGTGTGTWKYNKGKIELNAERDIFDMYIEVFSTDDKAEILAIRFTDRKGENTMKMESKNLQAEAP